MTAQWPAIAMAVLGPVLCAQTQADQTPRIVYEGGGHWYDRFSAPYTPRSVPGVRLENSSRIDGLLRAGNLYLSLPDAIALALENNLDVEFERFWPAMAGTDLERAKGGGTLRGISLTVTEAPQGIGGPAAPLVTAAASGSLQGATLSSNLTDLAAITPSTSGISITGAVPLSAGPPVPLFDPALTGELLWQRQTTPEVSSLVSGTSALASHGPMGAIGVSQGFSTGGFFGLNFNASRQNTNSARYTYNPYDSSSLGLTFTQPLLRGFGPGVNRRFIRIAQNSRRTADLVFRQQAIATVAGVIRLYDDLVSLIEDVTVKEQTLATAQSLFENNRVSAEQGTLAPVELTRAQAQVAAAEQDLTNSRGYERQQELILKNAITRRGTADARVRDARLVPTTPIEIPANEPVRPTEDLMAQAFRDRPELEEARLQIQNSQIGLQGSRNEVLPQLDLVATAQNSGLAGQSNALAASAAGVSSASGAAVLPGDQSLAGGFGTGLSQLFTGRFPSYSVGIQLSLPLRNRVALADMARDEMQVRQWQVRYQGLVNQVRLEVESALIELDRARAAYNAAVETRRLQEQSLQIETERYGVGLSTTFLVLQYQSFVAQARSTEVAARGAYAKARIALERALGATLEAHEISFEEAMRGRVNRPAGQ